MEVEGKGSKERIKKRSKRKGKEGKIIIKINSGEKECRKRRWERYKRRAGMRLHVPCRGCRGEFAFRKIRRTFLGHSPKGNISIQLRPLQVERRTEEEEIDWRGGKRKDNWRAGGMEREKKER